MLGRLIGEDIQIRIIPGANLGSVTADPGQLQQILMNLALNARDAMPSGGAMTFQTANQRLPGRRVRTRPRWSRATMWCCRLPILGRRDGRGD